MKFVKLYRPKNNDYDVFVQIHAHYRRGGVKHILDLVAELRKDFEGFEIPDDDIEVQKAQEDRTKGIGKGVIFIEAFIKGNPPKPKGYKGDMIAYVL